MAGSEGLDFKFIRQVHILEPWYNINRIEQIIGRAVRTCSHKDLPFIKRNVKIYMYGTILSNSEKEATDLLIYRKSEEKAIKIGKITRILKESSIDCLLNNKQIDFSEEKLKQIYNKPNKILLSNNENVEYFIGNKIHSAICDYMESCEYKCNNESSLVEETDINKQLKTYNSNFLESNNDKIYSIIQNLFKENFFYNKHEIIQAINLRKKLSPLVIKNSLNYLLNNDNILFKDKFNNPGYIIKIDDLFIFQPNELKYKNSSLHTKINPKFINTEKIIYNVGNNFKQTTGMKKADITSFKKEEDLYTARNIVSDSFFIEFFNIYKNILSGNTNYITTVKKFIKNHRFEIISKIIEINKKSKLQILDYEDTSQENNIFLNYNYLTYILVEIILDSINDTNYISLILRQNTNVDCSGKITINNPIITTDIIVPFIKNDYPYT